ncbi:MAG: hypothetical protein ACI9OJ_006060 [Myxococcota bacterium]|jgi:hypothetical protein
MQRSSFDSVSQVLRSDGRAVTAVAYTDATGDLRVAVAWRDVEKRPTGTALLSLLDALEAAVGREVNLVDLDSIVGAKRRAILADGEVLFDLPPGRLQSLKTASVLDAFDADFAALLTDPKVTGRRRK